ncbi:MAG: hypothetical protein KDD29_09125 [Flavobacteriales bacterium]|nr:hypothetical protein [Flavobacteriales bacterium]
MSNKAKLNSAKIQQMEATTIESETLSNLPVSNEIIETNANEDVQSDNGNFTINGKVYNFVNAISSSTKQIRISLGTLIVNALKAFIEIGGKIAAIKDYHKAEIKPLKTVKADINGYELDLCKLPDFFTYLFQVKALPFGYAQATKYLACFLNKESLTTEAITKEGLQIEDLTDLNEAAKFAKDPTKYDKRPAKEDKPERLQLTYFNDAKKVTISALKSSYTEKDLLGAIVNLAIQKYGQSIVSETTKQSFVESMNASMKSLTPVAV